MAQNNTTSTTLRNHRHKRQLEAIAHHIDHLCAQYDSLAAGHPDRPRLMRQIEHWNVEYQAED
jgi:hypothetical protein